MAESKSYSVVLGERGRLVLPAPLRRQLGVEPGDRLIFTMDEEGVLRVLTAREVARRGRGMFAHVAPERSLVDELIAERREEARREDEESRGEAGW
jgi:AbrB family looped-hinge helix DNA binding protein